MPTQATAQTATLEAPQRHSLSDRSESQPDTASSALPVVGLQPGRRMRAAAAAARPRRRTKTDGGPPLHPPYGNEPSDHVRYRYGYPPCCGRMFGSGN
jgi:hypothetical protein